MPGSPAVGKLEKEQPPLERASGELGGQPGLPEDKDVCEHLVKRWR
jgi:hypothetical protein